MKSPIKRWLYVSRILVAIQTIKIAQKETDLFQNRLFVHFLARAKFLSD